MDGLNERLSEYRQLGQRPSGFEITRFLGDLPRGLTPDLLHDAWDMVAKWGLIPNELPDDLLTQISYQGPIHGFQMSILDGRHIEDGNLLLVFHGITTADPDGLIVSCGTVTLRLANGLKVHFCEGGSIRLLRDEIVATNQEMVNKGFMHQYGRQSLPTDLRRVEHLPMLVLTAYSAMDS